MKLKLFQVDAFASKLFSGNPAAVVPLTKWLDDELMLSIAAENNLSETAFFVEEGDEYSIRWFTPEVEINLCGHATLASAHVLFNYLNYSRSKIIFNSMSGKLSVEKKENDILALNFPSLKPELILPVDEISKGLGAVPKEFLKSIDYFLVFENEEEILSINPDFNILKNIPTRGFIVTAKGNNSDFVSRFFAPGAGVNEDPVTGSAHSQLIPYWSEKLNKNDLYAIQLSKRKGELFCSQLNDRVEIAGKSVTYLIGEIEGLKDL